jgi:hypothetical protein
MSVQFGIAAMNFGGVQIGYLQNVSMDFSFETATLYSGAAMYPVDVRSHTATISGTAEFADITAAALEKVLGGSRAGSTLTLSNTDAPTTFQLVVEIVTDSITFSITFNKCRSNKLSLPFVRDGHLIPSFDFQCEADSNGNVATIDVGDVS